MAVFTLKTPNIFMLFGFGNMIKIKLFLFLYVYLIYTLVSFFLNGESIYFFSFNSTLL